MKEIRCPSYNKNTEIEKTEVGSVNGKIIYKETEVILSEFCALLNKLDDFNCEECSLRKEFIKNEK